MKFLNYAIGAVHGGVIFLLILTTLNQWINPESISKLNFLSLAFPVLMIVNIALLFFWFLKRNWKFLIFMCFTLLLINPIRRWVNFTPKQNSGHAIKVVTFNAKNNSESQRIELENYLKSADYDLIMLQEASVIKPKSKLPYSYENELLVVTYSKYPIIKKKAILRYEDDRSCAIMTDVDINGKILRIFNIHLSSFMFEKKMLKPGADMEVNENKLKNAYLRLSQAFKKHQSEVAEIRKAIEQSPYPVLVCGDLNSVPNSYEYYHISKGLKDVFLEAGRGFANSFHDYKFPIRIDYVFTSESINAKEYKVDRSVSFSDHYPVEAKIEF